MPSYSSHQLYQDWRYAIAEEFMTSSGEPFPYAKGGHLSWDDEDVKIEVPHASSCSVSGNGTHMAISSGTTVSVFDTNTWERTAVLRGHLGQVDSVAFQPNDCNTLLTSNRYNYNRKNDGREDICDATIIVWRLDQLRTTPSLETDVLASISEASCAIAVDKLVDLGVTLAADEIQKLKTLFTPSLAHVVTKNMATREMRIHGSMSKSFQSDIFSPSGRWMVYFPGNSPRSNSVDAWDIYICSTDDYTTPRLKLCGHTDNIMWTGWSADESLFGSVAWDGSARIWDAVTGRQIYKFETGKQNWTGGFSPDSKFFAMTDGSGTVHIYNVQASPKQGAEWGEHWAHELNPGSGWRRALSWHPNSQWLAVGGERKCGLLLLDVQAKTVLQRRSLSGAASQVDEEELRNMAVGMTGYSRVQFVARGRKLVTWIFGDGSLEVLDLEEEIKWRFARGGTEDLPHTHKWRNDKGKLTSRPGYHMLAWEDTVREKLRMASLDDDCVRIWSIDLKQATE